MTGVHRTVFQRLGNDPDAVLLDTPFGFQENAAILARKAVEYFRDATGRNVEVAGLPRTDTGDVVAIERGLTRLRAADWVFAGPGSPSFALRQWRGTAVPDVLGDKLETGGALVFSSAAALTLGAVTVPVYEIYKAGADPYWLEGLDLLAAHGLPVAVIPHYDNREGGNHDTRFCYLGERRLAMLEAELPADHFVLGIDEHTGMIVDLDADTAEIVGRGGLTLRRSGRSVHLEAGRTVPLDVLRSAGRERGVPTAVTSASATREQSAGHDDATTGEADIAESLASATATAETAFEEALDRRAADDAVAAILGLESAIVEWSRDTLQSDQVDRARAALRSMVVRLGATATEGLRDRREVLGPLVEAALAARRVARADGSFAVADALRDGLAAAGVEVRDTADGTEWVIA